MTEQTTYTEALETQCKLMMDIARRLDEKGYAVIVQGRASASLDNAMRTFLTHFAKKKWGDGPLAKRIRPVFIHVWASDLTNVRDTMYNMYAAIPNRRHYKPINTALMMFSKKKNRKTYAYEGSGFILADVDSNWVNYRATTKDSVTALGVIIRHLEMPDHRKILLGQ